MIASLRLEDATMDVEVRRNKDEIFSSDPIFDRREKSVSPTPCKTILTVLCSAECFTQSFLRRGKRLRFRAFFEHGC